MANANARAMRRQATDAERALWKLLRNRQLEGAKFRRQAPIGPYIADFICYDARLVVEADGGQHADSEHDRVRDRWFACNGYRILRFWNNDILTNPEGVITSVQEELARTPPHPPRTASSAPSPARGEGLGP